MSIQTLHLTATASNITKRSTLRPPTRQVSGNVMSQGKTVHDVIAEAERILPGREAKSANCPRWQVIIAVGEFIESDPIPVCDFALKWARRRGRDLRSAIYCCLTEHLLEHHFDLVLPRMREAARDDARVAEHLIGTWRSPFKFGQAEKPANIRRLKRLDSELRRIHPTLAGST